MIKMFNYDVSGSTVLREEVKFHPDGTYSAYGPGGPGGVAQGRYERKTYIHCEFTTQEEAWAERTRMETIEAARRIKDSEAARRERRGW